MTTDTQTDKAYTVGHEAGQDVVSTIMGFVIDHPGDGFRVCTDRHAMGSGMRDECLPWVHVQILTT